MYWVSVKSSVITAVGYDKKTLYVVFNSGRVYGYLNVPQKEFLAFLNASSYGGYFNQWIKDHYRFKKI